MLALFVVVAAEVPTSSLTETSKGPVVGDIQASLTAIDENIKSTAAKLGSDSTARSSFAEARKIKHVPAATHNSQHQRQPQEADDVDDDSIEQIEAKGLPGGIAHHDGLDDLRRVAKAEMGTDPSWLDHQILDVSSQVDNIRHNIPDDRVLLVLEATGNKADAQAELESQLADLKKIRDEFSVEPASLLEFNDDVDVDDSTIGADAFDEKLNSLDEKISGTEADKDDAAEPDPFADQGFDAGRARVSSLLDKFGGPNFDATDEYSNMPDPMNPASPLDDLNDVPSDFTTNKDLPKLYSVDDQLRKMD